MNGPNPVCTSARKKMNQSRPRKLRADGCGGSLAPICDGTTRNAGLPGGGPKSWGAVRSIRRGWPDRRFLRLPYSGSACKPPAAPSTTTASFSLYSGAALTWSRVKSDLTRSRLPLVSKCSAFQSTAILRLPTPRKPPKSITAARTRPSRSTTTSTIRPMLSSALVRTSLPSTLCAWREPSTVTEAALGDFCWSDTGADWRGGSLGPASSWAPEELAIRHSTPAEMSQSLLSLLCIYASRPGTLGNAWVARQFLGAGHED